MCFWNSLFWCLKTSKETLKGESTGTLLELKTHEAETLEDYKKDYLDTAKNPFIIHYSGIRKPWTHPELPLAECFWKVVKETPIYNRIITKYIADFRKESEKANCFKKYRYIISN